MTPEENDPEDKDAEGVDVEARWQLDQIVVLRRGRAHQHDLVRPAHVLEQSRASHDQVRRDERLHASDEGCRVAVAQNASE